MKNYYTYAYLREDGTPYYVGKGKGNRSHRKYHTVAVPPFDRILILKKDLSEDEAIQHEIYMIAVLGRKDSGTGILRNLTNGGEGTSGYSHREETKRNIGNSNRGRERPEELRRRISASVSGYSWYNDGVRSIQARSHPGEGWVTGRILNWHTPRNTGMKWYHRDGVTKLFPEDPGQGWQLGRPRPKGKKYYNNGTEHVLAFESPGDGWVPGRLKVR